MEARPPKDLEWSERTTGRETSFVLTPSRLNAIPLLVFASIWDSFFVMLWAGLSRAHAPDRAYLFPIAHAAVGLVVSWLAVARCFNVFRISLNGRELVIRQSPVPTRGLRVSTETIDRFAADDAEKDPKGTQVHAVTRDRSELRLGLHLDGRDEVTYVAARLNAALATARGAPTGRG